MTDTEKLKLIRYMILDFWRYDPEDKGCYETLVSCIASVINYKGDENEQDWIDQAV